MRLLKPDWIPTPLIGPDVRPHVEIAATPRARRFSSRMVVVRLVWWVATILWWRLIGRGGAAMYGRHFRLLLEDLGGLWIKLGQLLSLRVDLFPLEFCRELSQLQVKAVGFSPTEAIRIVEEDLGGPITEVFSTFDAAPVAAASIGQVHLAELRGSGLRVAVKVQRPHLPRTFAQQFRVIQGIVWFVRLVGYRSHMRWEDLVWELRHIMLEEMDCRYEASSTRRMRGNLKAHGIYVPKVFQATRRVLVTEFIDGVLMADSIRMLSVDPESLDRWRLANGIDARRVGRHLVLSLLRQLIEDNLFHGDLHPGNILLLRDNRVALIDFGSCSFSERGTLEWFRMSILALGRRNYAKAADLYVLLAGTLPQGVDVQAIRDRFLQALCEWGARTPVRDLPYHDKSIAAIYNAVLRILYEHHCTMEWALLRIRRGLETLDASLIHLLPDCDYSEIAETYTRQAERRQTDADADAARRPAAALAAVHGTFEIGIRLAEYTMFQAGLLRRHVRVFDAAGNKAMVLLSSAVTQLALLGLLATGLAVAIWLAQRQPQWVSFLGDEAVGRLSRQLPAFDWQIWAFLLAASAYGAVTLMRLRGRLRRHERRAAEHVAAL
jgi:ubiquinone biosynthesis protein